jgi:hypothetical protein
VAKLAPYQQAVEQRRGGQVQGIDDSNSEAPESIGCEWRSGIPSVTGLSEMGLRRRQRWIASCMPALPDIGFVEVC